jgi:hypothetical protein
MSRKLAVMELAEGPHCGLCVSNGIVPTEAVLFAINRAFGPPSASLSAQPDALNAGSVVSLNANIPIVFRVRRGPQV